MGIDLAAYFRSINSKLPIFILTNFPDDAEFSGKKGNVENIIDKSDFADSEKKRTLAARILRHTGTYRTTLEGNERKFHVLLKKSLTQALSAEEMEELETLQFIRTSSVLASELDQLSHLEKVIEQNNILLNKIGNK